VPFTICNADSITVTQMGMLLAEVFPLLASYLYWMWSQQ